jgi:uncharacterized protein YjbI with pentapeptide repeats
MRSLVLIITLIDISIFWYGFESGRVNATVGSETNANLSGANLTGVNLTGVILDGVVFCNTTMLNRKINNVSC